MLRRTSAPAVMPNRSAVGHGISEREDESVEIPGFGEEHEAEEHHGDYP